MSFVQKAANSPQEDSKEGSFSTLTNGLAAQGTGNESGITSEVFKEGILDIHVHYAEQIHNICIYGKQDVFAKFFVLQMEDNAVCTKVSNNAGQNPVFDEKLRVNFSQPNAVLKCEMWMASRDKSYLPDQLLGSLKIPLLEILAKQKYAEDYGLSSTELFHSPAGTVRLSFSFSESSASSDVTKVVNLDTNIEPQACSKLSQSVLCSPILTEVFGDSDSVHPKLKDEDKEGKPDFKAVDFPDLQTVNEDSLLVSDYLEMAAAKKERLQHEQGILIHPPFLELPCLGNGDVVHADLDANPDADQDCSNAEMPNLENSPDSRSRSCEASNREKDNGSESSTPVASSESSHAQSAESRLEPKLSSGESFAPTSSLSFEANSGIAQDEIVNMYMKSMQQFTEALEKMQLPLDSQNPEKSIDEEEGTSKKSSQRVFYGSRAFF